MIDFARFSGCVDNDREVVVFLTRSIRRKMVFGLALVLVMLATLSLSGISGQLSHRKLVNDLDFCLNQAPQRSDLVAAIGLLREPLLLRLSETPRTTRFPAADFAEQLKRTRRQVLEYRRKLDNMPPMAVNWVNETLLAQVDARLDRFEAMQHSLDEPHTAQKMLVELVELEALVQRVPDPPVGLNRTLQDARHVYRSRFVLVCVTSAIVVILFLSLVGCGYRWIFAPIRKLHQGASRVAQGDFDYRVTLTTNDEMAELAESFNQMTARFQEIAGDLDRQVRERSRQLVRSERLAGVGFLAANVAHEINNPLAAIKWTVESLEGRKNALLAHADRDETEVVSQYLTLIGREALRCQQMTSKLLNFSRGEDGTRARNDVTNIITEVLDLVSQMKRFRDRNIVFSRAEPCYLEVNGPEIKQVVLNLVANAMESLDDGGRLEITIIEQTDQVVIAFTDDGSGMTRETIENLFEPFFTTKKQGQGTGLGLSISHRIVSDHGGTMEATSDGPGCGSTFSVRLPRRAGGSRVQGPESREDSVCVIS